MGLTQYRRPGKLWYASDGYIWDDHPVAHRQEEGRPLECSSKLFVYNPQRRKVKGEVRIYKVDAEPARIPFAIGAGRIEALELAGRSEVPHRQSFWIAVEAEEPVLPQARHEDFTFWDPVPDAAVAVAPYPGPLEDETSWVLADCYQGTSGSWHERETLTILNPGKRSVRVRVRYLLDWSDLGGEEEVEIGGERVAELETWTRVPRLLDSENGPPVQPMGDYAVRIDASEPVVVQSTRRARWVSFASIIGSRSTMGLPLRGRGHRRWYYPGGEVIDYGVLPRALPDQHALWQCDNTWNLLFVNNLSERSQGKFRVSFHGADGRCTRSGPVDVTPLKSKRLDLHGAPWLGEHLKVDEPFAMTVTADRPIVAEVTEAEFEMWSQVCPGSMTAVNLYPGPLSDETVWWLGIGHAGGADERNLEWRQCYYLFNPGKGKVNVEMEFLGAGRKLKKKVGVGAGAVRKVESIEVEGLSLDRPFAVKASGDGPFCAQVFGRTFTRGLPHVRGMYSAMGTPMALVDR